LIDCNFVRSLQSEIELPWLRASMRTTRPRWKRVAARCWRKRNLQLGGRSPDCTHSSLLYNHRHDRIGELWLQTSRSCALSTPNSTTTNQCTH